MCVCVCVCVCTLVREHILVGEHNLVAVCVSERGWGGRAKGDSYLAFVS